MATRKPSAGLLVHRRRAPGEERTRHGGQGTRDGRLATRDGRLEVLLVHPGGPFWAKRDAGAWSIPKGEYEPGEDPLSAARREFAEELGVAAPAGEPIDLGEVRQRSGKVVRAWALAGDLDVSNITSNTCWVQWPPRSGKQIEVPEVDRAEWFDTQTARAKINAGQIPLLDRLHHALRQH